MCALGSVQELTRRGVCTLRYVRDLTPMDKAAERWDFKLRLLMTGLHAGLESFGPQFGNKVGMRPLMLTVLNGDYIRGYYNPY